MKVLHSLLLQKSMLGMVIMKKQSKDIFISYRRDDGYLFANLLATKLAELGYSVFYDRDDLVIGEDFPERLHQAILECNEFISLVSPMYFGAVKNDMLRIGDPNDWVHQEIGLALTYNKRVLPIILDADMENAPPLPEDIGSFFDLNFLTYDRQNTIEEFVATLEKGFSADTVKNRKYNTLLKELYDICDESDNDFNIKIRNFIISRSEDVIESKLLPMIENREENEDVCFAAYYAAFTFYRRMGYAYKIHDLVDRFGQRFNGYRFNSIVLSQHYRLRFELDGNKPEDLIHAAQAARRATEVITGNAGVLQNYADLITRGFELGVYRSKEDLAIAVDCVNRALKINPKYPKYFCTLGRLLSFQGKYKDAVVNIQRAINLENSETKDSFIRIMEYNRHITDIKLRQTEHKMKKWTCAMTIAVTILTIAVCLLWLITWRKS